MEAGAAQGRLQRAEQRVDTLSVAAERERIGRDLHDILGHSLTAISIKAGLAARLVDLDPAAAKAQIAEIEQVSRQALADVRATASGMREVRLATEIASARSVLLAAGIESRMPSALPPLTDAAERAAGLRGPRGGHQRGPPQPRRRLHRSSSNRQRSRSATTVADFATGRAVGLRSGRAAQPGGGDRRDPAGRCRRRAAGPSCGPTLGSPATGRERVRPPAVTAPMTCDRPVITVLLADDQAMIRQAFTALLQLEADIGVVGQAGDVAETVRKVAETSPEVVLLDVQMPVAGGRSARTGSTPAPSSWPRAPRPG